MMPLSIEAADASAMLTVIKTTDKAIAYMGDILTYSFAVTNTGSLPADQVVLTDIPPVGTLYVPNSLTANVPVSGDPTTNITFLNSIEPGQTVTVSFQLQIVTGPIPNPIENWAEVSYSYTIDPENPDSITVITKSNTVVTFVFRNHYSQQINDLIHSIALEEAAIAAITNAEGSKIQKIIAMGDSTAQELLCLNKSVADILESIALLESILRQKLNVVSCQINQPCV